MSTELYLQCFGVAFVGWLVQTVLKLRALSIKARAANVKFHVVDYFTEDYLSIAASMLTIILFLFFIQDGLKWKPELINSINLIFGFVGYTGSDIASRLFSVINTNINKAIDYKTTISDTQTGTLDKPTPVK